MRKTSDRQVLMELKQSLNYTIREGRRTDVDDILVLWRQLFEMHAKLDSIFEPAPDGEKYYLKWLNFHFNDRSSEIVVAEISDRIIGYCLAQVKNLPPVLVHRRIGVISDMAIDQEHRDLGIGRALYADMEQRLLKQDISRIELKTATTNQLSNHFWEKVCGFNEFVKVRSKDFC